MGSRAPRAPGERLAVFWQDPTAGCLRHTWRQMPAVPGVSPRALGTAHMPVTRALEDTWSGQTLCYPLVPATPACAQQKSPAWSLACMNCVTACQALSAKSN